MIGGQLVVDSSSHQASHNDDGLDSVSQIENSLSMAPSNRSLVSGEDGGSAHGEAPRPYPPGQGKGAGKHKVRSLSDEDSPTIPEDTLNMAREINAGGTILRALRKRRRESMAKAQEQATAGGAQGDAGAELASGSAGALDTTAGSGVAGSSPETKQSDGTGGKSSQKGSLDSTSTEVKNKPIVAAGQDREQAGASAAAKPSSTAALSPGQKLMQAATGGKQSKDSRKSRFSFKDVVTAARLMKKERKRKKKEKEKRRRKRRKKKKSPQEMYPYGCNGS